MNELSIIAIAVGGGLAYGNLGYSHHAVQDFSFIRSLPNMLIVSPGDPMEMSTSVDFLIRNPQPSYLRINKSGEKILFQYKPKITPGHLNIIKGDKYSKKIKELKMILGKMLT